MPDMSFEDEVEAYLRLKSGDLRDFATVLNLNGLGCALIAARIARGISQAELAEKMEDVLLRARTGSD